MGEVYTKIKRKLKIPNKKVFTLKQHINVLTTDPSKSLRTETRAKGGRTGQGEEKKKIII